MVMTIPWVGGECCWPGAGDDVVASLLTSVDRRSAGGLGLRHRRLRGPARLAEVAMVLAFAQPGGVVSVCSLAMGLSFLWGYVVTVTSSITLRVRGSIFGVDGVDGG
jgi:hypothetical protein